MGITHGKIKETENRGCLNPQIFRLGVPYDRISGTSARAAQNECSCEASISVQCDTDLMKVSVDVVVVGRCVIN